jgi:hypothetical protein
MYENRNVIHFTVPIRQGEYFLIVALKEARMNLGSVSDVGSTSKELDESRESRDSGRRNSPVKVWQEYEDGPDDTSSRARDPHGSTGWNPAEIWRQRIKRKSDV